jgi:hypothetical protein
VQKGATDTSSCEEYVVNGRLTPSMSYSLIYKQLPSFARRATAVEAPRRGLLPAVDEGLSWDQILRFANITFETGGKFKACFCDYETLEEGKYCKYASDYKIEIGTIHVSGISCLIEDPKFQRGTCVDQFHGGMRCYPGKAPKITVPEDDDDEEKKKAPKKKKPTKPLLSAFCLYGPEEETRDDPLCNL